MRSKACLLSTLMLTAACGLNVGEKAPPGREMTVPSSQFACVGEIAKKTELYIHAEMSEEEINSFVGCLQNSFRSFSLRMSGAKERESFTPEEIRDFIQKLLPQDSLKITDELLYQFMLIKQNLVGGALNQITRSDLEAAIQILGQIRDEAVRMRPYIPILNPRLVAKEDRPSLGGKIADAEAAALETGQVFGKILSRSQKPYSFRDFEQFLSEFRKFSRWEEHFPNGHAPKEWVDLVAAFKAVAVSVGDKEISGSDWTPLFQYGVQWYLNYIKFEVGIRNQPTLMEGVGLQNLIGWGDSILELLTHAVIRQPNQMIPFNSTDHLIAALDGVGWLPKKIRASSLQTAMRASANRIFGPDEMNSCVRSSPGITKFVVSNLAHEFGEWQDIQLALQEKYSVIEGRRQRLKSLESKMPALKTAVAISDEPSGRESWDRLLDSFQGTRALFKEDFEHVYLSETVDFQNGFFNLSKMNVFRAVVSLMFKGYAPMSARGVLDAKLSQERLQAFYEDFREIGIDLGFIDRRVSNAGSRTFIEGKLFTYLSDGVNPDHPDLTFAQTMEEAAFLYSGGELSRDLYNVLLDDCGPGPNDIYGKPKLDRGCVEINLTNELMRTKVPESMPALRIAETLPSYAKFLSGLDPVQRKTYRDTLLRSAFSKKNLIAEPNGKDFVEQSEFATMAVVIQYAEAVMTRYNTAIPENDFLDDQEVDKALDVFRDLARMTVPKPELGWLKNVPWLRSAIQNIPQLLFAEDGFKFVLQYGRIPTSTGDYATIWNHSQANAEGLPWDLHVDRQALAEVFATLIQKISEQPPPPKQNIISTCK